MPVDKSAPRVQQMFAEIASGYDRMNHMLSCQVDRYWRLRTVRALPPRGPAPILDVCTGTGDLALAFWRHYGHSVPIVGTDFCPEMLQLADRKKERRGITRNLTFQPADTEYLPFSDGQFQIVSVAFGLRNVSSTRRGLQEMTRVCQPGGQVAILEFSLPRWEPVRSIYGWYFRRILPKLGQALMRNRQNAYEYLPQSVGEFPEGRAMLHLMEEAGLRHCREIRLTFGVATLYIGERPTATIPAYTPLSTEEGDA